MRIEVNKIVKVDELAHLIPRKKGKATFSQLWHIFYYTRLFKYIHKSNYCQIKPAFSKICTNKNLKKLCELGYLKSPGENIYCAKNKVLPILKEAGFFTDLLPNEPIGKGDLNELKNTECFIHLTKVKDFYIILFPQFGFLIPDCLLVQFDKENSKYKLTFIEVEAKKSKWSDYIDDKRDKYLRLAKIMDFYDYWKTVAPILQIPIPTLDDFKFSVIFICSITKNYEEGFKFISSATEICQME